VLEELKTRKEAIHIVEERTLTCTCGRVIRTQYIAHSCGCGAIVKRVPELNRKNEVMMKPVLDVLHKDDRSFHIEKREVFVVVDTEDYSMKYKLGRKLELKWSLKDRHLIMLRNGKVVEDTDKYDSFFR